MVYFYHPIKNTIITFFKNQTILTLTKYILKNINIYLYLYNNKKAKFVLTFILVQPILGLAQLSTHSLSTHLRPIRWTNCSRFSPIKNTPCLLGRLHSSRRCTEPELPGRQRSSHSRPSLAAWRRSRTLQPLLTS